MTDHKLRSVTKALATLNDWGITDCTVEVANQRGNVMRFTIPVQSVDTEEPVLVMGERVWLYSPKGVCVFIGRARQPKPVISNGSEAWTYICECAGETALERTPYLQHWRVPAGDVLVTPVGPETEMTTELVSLVTLFRNYDTGAKVGAIALLSDALGQAVEEASLVGESLGYDVVYVPNVEPPEDEKRDLTVLDVVECVLRWMPSVSSRWDYSAEYPVLRFSSAYGMNPSTGALFNPAVALGNGFEVRQAPVTSLVGLQAEPLDDRVTPMVTISYLITNSVDHIIWRSIQRDVSTVANGGYGKMEITVPLRGATWNGDSYEDPEPRPPAGLARALHQAFSVVWWKFEVVKVGVDVDWALQIGESWNVTGIGSADSSVAIAQRIVRDLSTGTTTISCGAPSHLGYSELVDLLMPNRLRTPPLRAGDQKWGFGEQEKKGKDAEDNADAANYPFKVTRVSAGTFRVQPGTVNTTIPATVGGAADWQFAISDFPRYIVLKAFFSDSGAAVVSSELRVESDLPTEPEGDAGTGAPPPHTWRVIAKVVSATEIEQYVKGPQSVWCGVSSFSCSTMQRNVVWYQGVA